MLKNHSNFGPDFFDIIDVVGQLDAIGDNPAPLMFLQTVYATLGFILRRMLCAVFRFQVY
jgi:hypothetical protein